MEIYLHFPYVFMVYEGTLSLFFTNIRGVIKLKMGKMDGCIGNVGEIEMSAKC